MIAEELEGTGAGITSGPRSILSRIADITLTSPPDSARMTEFGERDPEAAVDSVALAELVHMASLHHDDVMDQARTRRGAPSVNALWGGSVAVLAGNWLLAKAARLAAEPGPEILRLQARVTSRLVSGQIRELTGAACCSPWPTRGPRRTSCGSCSRPPDRVGRAPRRCRGPWRCCAAGARCPGCCTRCAT
ncbi:polyprenyl synthetase family protein [Streptomyces cucumeris]|uniref:polyprenyl synthetase family protein n=1 Tax=Streptomyces cucumeris TaxID=2962890 RepID=UPI003D72BA90